MTVSRAIPALIVTSVGALGVVVGCKGDDAKSSPPAASASVAPSSASASPPASAPVNALPIPSASVAAAVNPQNLPVYDGPTGSVEGTITIEGEPPPDVPGLDFKKCPEATAVYGKLFRAGEPGPDGKRPLADALVGVTGYAHGAYVAEKNEAVRVTFDGCAFVPRTVAMTFGQRLDVANKTKLVVAPALDRAPTPALMIAPPLEKGDPVHLYPPHPGYYTLEDKIELSYLRADVYVLLFPFHAATGLDGHYRIDGVPVGKAKVFTRLRAIGKETGTDVEILANVVQRVDLTLRYETPKDAGAPPADAGKRYPRPIP